MRSDLTWVYLCSSVLICGSVPLCLYASVASVAGLLKDHALEFNFGPAKIDEQSHLDAGGLQLIE